MKLKPMTVKRRRVNWFMTAWELSQTSQWLGTKEQWTLNPISTLAAQNDLQFTATTTITMFLPTDKVIIRLMNRQVGTGNHRMP